MVCSADSKQTQTEGANKTKQPKQQQQKKTTEKWLLNPHGRGTTSYTNCQWTTSSVMLRKKYLTERRPCKTHSYVATTTTYVAVRHYVTIGIFQQLNKKN